MDLVTAADMRMCTTDAEFGIKEVNVGIVADLGASFWQLGWDSGVHVCRVRAAVNTIQGLPSVVSCTFRAALIANSPFSERHGPRSSTIPMTRPPPPPPSPRSGP